ncbi:symmetrical bis(5'-nucleosyl)-tetraphosphatase [Methylomonas sp. MgM2]
MTTYAIGSVHGDFLTLTHLLQTIGFDPQNDRLWFAGNLVNGGSETLAVLRFVKSLGKNAVTVLGSQELHLLSVAAGVIPANTDDNFDELLAASDRDELLKWLRQRSLIHHDSKLGYTMVHAGIPGEWTVSQMLTFTYEVESALSGPLYTAFLENRRQDQSRWHAKLRGWKRTNFIANACTLMAYCNEQGKLDFNARGPANEQKAGLLPWYRLPDRPTANLNIVFADETGFQDAGYPGIYPLSSRTTLSVLKLAPVPEAISLVRQNDTVAALG